MYDDVLEKLNVDLGELCCFLIQLFNNTEKKYSCSRTKVGKILSILAFKYAMNGEKLFSERIYKYDGCGTSVETLIGIVCRDEYFSYRYHDDKREIHDEFNNCVEMPLKWQRQANIPYEVMIDTEDVFRKFGAYSQTDLSEVLNPIVEELTDESYGEIELWKIPFIINDLDQNNAVIKYLCECRPSKKINNSIREKIKTKRL